MLDTVYYASCDNKMIEALVQTMYYMFVDV